GCGGRRDLRRGSAERRARWSGDRLLLGVGVGPRARPDGSTDPAEAQFEPNNRVCAAPSVRRYRLLVGESYGEHLFPRFAGKSTGGTGPFRPFAVLFFCTPIL